MEAKKTTNVDEKTLHKRNLLYANALALKLLGEEKFEKVNIKFYKTKHEYMKFKAELDKFTHEFYLQLKKM